jgi:hypothetical protein
MVALLGPVATYTLGVLGVILLAVTVAVGITDALTRG